MREVTFQQLSDAVRELCIQANTILPQDLRVAICKAMETEQSGVGRAILGDLRENYEFAQAKGLPICQDTGMAVVFVDGVARGYVDGHLRLSVVADHLRRGNTNNNTPAILHLRMVPGDRVDLTVAPKGFGSENMSSLRMFNPSVTQEQVEDHIVDCVARAGSNPCPPVIVGVGLGGTSEVAAELAKRALLRPVGEHHPDPYYAEMESRILERVNRLGIGPQGLGGTTTAFWVSIYTYGTHIAGLPCAVNLGCHVTRHAHKIL